MVVGKEGVLMLGREENLLASIGTLRDAQNREVCFVALIDDDALDAISLESEAHRYGLVTDLSQNDRAVFRVIRTERSLVEREAYLKRKKKGDDNQ
jgi:hypothetical protein